MKEGKKRNKPAASGVITLACALALGAGAGWLGAWAADHIDFSPLLLAGTLILAAAGMMGQIILHEAGHLLGGLATGYAFVSFRVGSWMLLKRDGRLHLGRYTLPGTGGQCLMAPPTWKEDGFPALLYNLSGPLANLLAAAVCGAAAWLCRERAPLAALLLGVWALVGAYLGLLNGIPMKIQGMPNDGYNALRLRRDKASLRAVWAQLAINMAQTQGLRLGEVPEDWFSLPGDAGPTDPLKSAVWVCRYSRLLDQGRYQEADALCDTLLKTGDLALATPLRPPAGPGVFPSGGRRKGRGGEGSAGPYPQGVRPADEEQSRGGPGALGGRRGPGGRRPGPERAQGPRNGAGVVALPRRERGRAAAMGVVRTATASSGA